MKRLMNILLSVAVVMAICSAVQADTVNWATGGVTVDNLGNTCHTAFSTFPAESNRWDQTDIEGDKVTLGTASGSLNLVLGTPQTVVVNPLTFTVGWTGDMNETDTKSNVYYLIRDITVNNITKSLVNPITHGVTWAADSLVVQEGAPVAFGNIIVTPLGWGSVFSAGSYDSYTQTLPTWQTISPVSAEFNLVPEPGTLVLLGTAGLGLLCYAWRRRRSRP